MNAAQFNSLTRQVIGAAIAVHRELGPGLEEADYELALSTEFAALGLFHRRQLGLPVVYKGVRLDAGYRIDLLVEEVLVLEVKCVETLHPVHTAQILTYLRLSGRKLGLLMNFNVPLLKHGIRRIVLGLEEDGRPCEPSSAGCVPQSPGVDPASDDLSYAVLAAAIEVHRHLGPGLLASAYEACFCHELSLRHLPFERRKVVPVRFRGVELPKPAQVCVVVRDQLPLLVTSLAEVSPLLEAQFLGQMKVGGWRCGLLLNFGERTMMAGVRHLLNPNAKNRG